MYVCHTNILSSKEKSNLSNVCVCKNMYVCMYGWEVKCIKPTMPHTLTFLSNAGRKNLISRTHTRNISRAANPNRTYQQCNVRVLQPQWKPAGLGIT